MRNAQFSNDQTAIEALGPARQDFEAWMAALDAEHRKFGQPYGKDDIWDCTGPACWIDAFREGLSPADALEEDFSNA